MKISKHIINDKEVHSNDQIKENQPKQHKLQISNYEMKLAQSKAFMRISEDDEVEGDKK